MNFFLSTLDEYQRRLYVGLESKKLGHGGDQQLSVITYMRVDTIAKGRHELEQAGPTDRIRAPGGRRCRSKKALALLMALERLLPGATAGDPCSLLKRKHKSLRRLSAVLALHHRGQSANRGAAAL